MINRISGNAIPQIYFGKKESPKTEYKSKDDANIEKLNDFWEQRRKRHVNREIIDAKLANYIPLTDEETKIVIAEVIDRLNTTPFTIDDMVGTNLPRPLKPRRPLH